jgi:hypothetical protein
MLKKTILMFCLGGWALITHAGDPQVTFDSGKALASKMQGTMGPSISSGSAATGLKGSIKTYTDTPPEAGMYGNPEALITKSNDLESLCSAPGPKDPKCAGVKVSKTKAPDGYLSVGSKIFKGTPAFNNPEAFLGDLAGQYSACTTVMGDVKTPAVFEDKTCNLSMNVEPGQTCTYNRVVKPAGSRSCVTGDILADVIGVRGGSDKAQFKAICHQGGPEHTYTFQIQAWGGKGSCTPPITVMLDMSKPTTTWKELGTVKPHWDSACKIAKVVAKGPGCRLVSGSMLCTQTFNVQTFTKWGWINQVSSTLEFFAPHYYAEEADVWAYQLGFKKVKAPGFFGGWVSVVAPTCEPQSKVPPFIKTQSGQTGPGLDGVPMEFLAAAPGRVCFKKSDQCVAGPETRIVDGTPVYRDCWRREEVYECASGDSFSCTTDEIKKCSPDSPKKCLTKEGDICVSMEQSFKCETSPATYHASTTCADSTTFCENGSCYDKSYAPNDQFGKSAAILQVAKEAGKDMAANPDQIVFKGQEMACKTKIGGILDCCDLDSKLDPVNPTPLDLAGVGCSDAEKDLAVRRAMGKCHVGDTKNTDCLVKVPWPGKGCAVWNQKTTKVCCFGSKLVRIIHEQGRPQIGRGWGSFDATDCAGFTVEDLQKMDFSAMDFSEFIADIKVTMPNTEAIKSSAKTDSTNCYYGAGKC